MRIDWWTLALQAINLLILVWILGRFFYRPVAAIIEQRRVAAAKVLADATASRMALEGEQKSIATTRAGFAAERERVLADARHQAEAERDAMLNQAREAGLKARAENDASLARAREAAERETITHAGTLAVAIAQKLLTGLPPGIALPAFLETLSEQIAQLPDRDRKLLASERPGIVEVVTAASLDDVQKAECQTAIDKATGHKTALSFHVDPSLIAGVELRTGALAIKDSWRESLSRILRQIQVTDGQAHLP